MTKPKLEISDGNAFFILGRAQKVAKENNMDWEPIKADAISGNYDHLLAVIQEHFDVEIIAPRNYGSDADTECLDDDEDDDEEEDE